MHCHTTSHKTTRDGASAHEPAAAPTYRSAGVASATSSFGALALDTAPPQTVPPSRTPVAVPSGPPPMTEEERAAYLRLFGGAARGTRTLSRRAAGPVFAKAKMAEGEVDAIWVYAAAATHSALSPNHALPPAAGPPKMQGHGA
ncbi:hypothetical protein EMIHUDRAFT_236086 [Emiliania huxleyi CCMP1516]|uniref:Uncharacterized protein n=2 Tax=Emiliania huxleyi TaxID=2903 RepID=A0A0D3JU29_EMIH1|nr:hypothetical protein EMIHUDRAFT_236086 [Emiliania huxleyi CCMP1516]EOD27014.1 hypothetical protein EMIHUDRAFT_236086 [Emiliania huxleyi CCMP1516]|eukprot:XP_005779443.1 hypothetical protein EMIHUDRAFT_236086 [Emiliania huxleyi CCMP1516]